MSNVFRQVFRIPVNSTTPNLILGEKFIHGSDERHFCKPTDVAVLASGEFFVSDGCVKYICLHWQFNSVYLNVALIYSPGHRLMLLSFTHLDTQVNVTLIYSPGHRLMLLSFTHLDAQVNVTLICSPDCTG